MSKNESKASLIANDSDSTTSEIQDIVMKTKAPMDVAHVKTGRNLEETLNTRVEM